MVCKWPNAEGDGKRRVGSSRTLSWVGGVDGWVDRWAILLVKVVAVVLIEDGLVLESLVKHPTRGRAHGFQAGLGRRQGRDDRDRRRQVRRLRR